MGGDTLMAKYQFFRDDYFMAIEAVDEDIPEFELELSDEDIQIIREAEAKTRIAQILIHNHYKEQVNNGND